MASKWNAQCHVEWFQVHKPAVCGDTLVAAVLFVPVFAVDSRVGAASSHTDVWTGGGGHARPGSHIHLHLHLTDTNTTALFVSCKFSMFCSGLWGHAYPVFSLPNSVSRPHHSRRPPHLHRQIRGRQRRRRVIGRGYDDGRAGTRLPCRRHHLDLQWRRSRGGGRAPSSRFGLQGRRSLGVHHLLQPRWRRRALHLLQRRRLPR